MCDRARQIDPRYPRYPQPRHVVFLLVRLGFDDSIMTVSKGCGSEKSQKHQELMPRERTGAARKPLAMSAGCRSPEPIEQDRENGGGRKETRQAFQASFEVPAMKKGVGCRKPDERALALRDERDGSG